MADKDKDEQEKTIAEDLVVTKYKMAGEISNRKFTSGVTSCFQTRVFLFRFFLPTSSSMSISDRLI